MAAPERQPEPSLVVIVGPTASGKTALAIKLAQQYDGEIICADSRTVYRGMDIGTAKPSQEEQAAVPHWGLDLVEPGERFTAADFKRYAVDKIAEIRARGHVPLLVGGAGLYVDGVVYDYEFGGGYSREWRARLEAMAFDELYVYCDEHNIVIPENKRNRRHIIRAIERKNISAKRRSGPIENTIVVGIATNKDELRTRIGLRAEQMLANGVVDEAIRLGKKYGWSNEAMTGNIYALVRRHLKNELSNDDVRDRITTYDWKLAKRQMTWFRRNPYIYWGKSEQLYRYVASVLEHKM